MAEELTNDSTQTTEAPTEQPSAQPQTTDTSTTADQTPPEDTLLTPKTEDEKPAETEQTDEEKAAAAERDVLFGEVDGDYEITGLPEGMTVDKEALDKFAPVAKQLGLSNEGMSLVAKTYAEILPDVTQKVVEGLQSDIAATQTQWANEAQELVKTDAAFGGKPMAEVQQVAAKSLDKFGGTEFREFLQSTGLGNHPAMVKFAYLAGSLIAEDTTFERGGATAAPKSRVEKFYPNST